MPDTCGDHHAARTRIDPLSEEAPSRAVHRLKLRRLLACAGALFTATLWGCAGLPESHPPGGTVITAPEKQCFGPYTTATQVVMVDGARGPEHYRVSYTYSALLVEGSAEVRATGGLRLLEGTLLVHADRSLRRISASEALAATTAPAPAITTASTTGSPTASTGGAWRLDELVAQVVSPDDRGMLSRDGSGAVSSLWWYPIVVGNPTQGGTTGTTFVVQQSTDSSGAGVVRFFLRPPTTRLFCPPSKLWIARSDYSDGIVTWLTDTESYAESVTVPPQLDPQDPKAPPAVPNPKGPQDPKDPKNWANLSAAGKPGVVTTTIRPLTDELRQWLTELEHAAAECGLKSR